MDQPWNANIHYDALLDAMVPLGTQCVLDVGCGDGLLAARLARRIPYVTAVDTPRVHPKQPDRGHRCALDATTGSPNVP